MTTPAAFDFPSSRHLRSGPAALFAIAEACRLERYYKDALACYLRAAQAGHAPAQNDYATMLLNGVGTPRDPEEAAFWYLQAANQGLAIAQYNLGTRYRTGDGVPLDLGEAARWLALAAGQGCTEAQCDLGVMHRLGHGMARDPRRAAEFLLAAAKAGDATALGNLAAMADELARLAGEGDAVAGEAVERLREHGVGAE